MTAHELKEFREYIARIEETDENGSLLRATREALEGIERRYPGSPEDIMQQLGKMRIRLSSVGIVVPEYQRRSAPQQGSPKSTHTPRKPADKSLKKSM